MPESSSGLVRMNPDGTISITVAGTRHTLRQITLGEHRKLRELYNEVTAEVTDYHDFDARPALAKAREAITAADTKAARAKARKALADVQRSQDIVVQGAWARWWREAIGTLSTKKLPEPSPDDLADGLEPWMVDTPASIRPMFEHWRSVPLEGSSDESLAETLSRLGGLSA